MSILLTLVTFFFVVGVLLWLAYAVIRPFTHTHYDHRDAFSPPWLEDFTSGPTRRPDA